MQSRPRERLNLLHLVVLGLFIVVFLRIPLKATKDCRDFAIIYLSSTSWRQGDDPYRYENYPSRWLEADGPPDKIPAWPSLYPVCTFPLIAPLTFLKWPVAKFIWILINCVAYLGLIMVLYSLGDYHLKVLPRIILFGALLLFPPALQAVLMGQPAILAILLGVLSWRAASASRGWGAGILLALSLCLKVNLGVIFLGYFIIFRQWKIVRVSLAVALIIMCVGVLKLGWRDFSWVSSWWGNSQVITQEWATNQPAARHPNIAFLMNLHYPLFRIFNSKLIVNVIVFMLGFIEFVILLRVYKYNESLLGNLTMLVTISTVVLLSSYHRLSDASVLVLLIIFIISLAESPYRKYNKLIIPLFLPFFLPSPIYLNIFAENGTIPQSVAASWWWNALVVPYQVYALLLMSLVMMFLAVTDKRELAAAKTSKNQHIYSLPEPRSPA